MSNTDTPLPHSVHAPLPHSVRWGGYYEAIQNCEDYDKINEPVFNYIKALEKTKNNTEIKHVVLSISEIDRNKLNSPVLDSLFVSFSSNYKNHFIDAIKIGSLAAVEFLIVIENKPSLYDLLLSVKLGRLEIFEFFLQFFYIAKEEEKILTIIYKYNQTEILEFLLKKKMIHKYTLLFYDYGNKPANIVEYCVKEKKLEILDLLLKYTNDRKSILYRICETMQLHFHTGDEQFLELLARYNYTPVLRTSWRITHKLLDLFPDIIIPCEYHKYHGSFELSKKLYKKVGGDPEKFYSPYYEHEECFKFFQLLVEDGLQVSNKNLQSCNKYVVKFLIDNGVKITDADFMYTINSIYPRIDILEIFITHGYQPIITSDMIGKICGSIPLFNILKAFYTLENIQAFLFFARELDHFGSIKYCLNLVTDEFLTVQNVNSILHNFMRRTYEDTRENTDFRIIESIVEKISFPLDQISGEILTAIFIKSNVTFISSLLKNKTISSIRIGEIIQRERFHLKPEVINLLMAYSSLDDLFEKDATYFITNCL